MLAQLARLCERLSQANQRSTVRIPRCHGSRAGSAGSATSTVVPQANFWLRVGRIGPRPSSVPLPILRVGANERQPGRICDGRHQQRPYVPGPSERDNTFSHA